MDFQECLEILELRPDANLNDVKQAYKDMVNVWHPDRYAHNPRLQHRAQEKLKRINSAFEHLQKMLGSPTRPRRNPDPEIQASRAEAHAAIEKAVEAELKVRRAMEKYAQAKAEADKARQEADQAAADAGAAIARAKRTGAIF